MHSSPSQAHETPPNLRQRAISAFALAPAPRLRSLFAALAKDAGHDVPEAMPVRGPEIGLVMLRGRAGGGGAPFNLGEASVCRATVRLCTGEVGHAMILGRDPEKARLAAHLDALWQHADWHERVESQIVAPLLLADAEDAAELASETEATRVDFFTVARGED
ncbi:phosphonate C-P lyase system protein PhnG [Aureimonas ureilytica]|uniref:phosphonate C-P lyase system protein PhnG n=1 Tax=Aureimonas ureilytica TaxID=401562 RepID=UPI0009E6BC39|nr:phosphonate C-P lyase system protein PhnG [Aureimonas ureilytica]